MRRMLVTLVLCLSVAPLAARAQPPGPPPGRFQAPNRQRARQMRMRMLRRVHTMAVLELGDLLDLSTDDTIRLSHKLQPFDQKRMKLQLATFDAMQGLRRAAAGRGGDAAALAREIADNRVKLAQLNRQELDTLLQGLSAQQQAKVALFVARFPERVAFIAREAQMHRMMERWGRMGGHGPGGPGMMRGGMMRPEPEP